MSTPYVTLADIRTFYGSVRMAWPGWIPAGHVSLIVGPESAGKSYLAAYLAATFAGRLPTWPDGAQFDGVPGPVVLVDTEEMRGAYAERVVAPGVGDDDILALSTPDRSACYTPTLPRDLGLLEDLAAERKCSAVVVDSLSGGHALDENSAAMRTLLQGLVGLAGRLRVPVIAVHHTRKRSTMEPVRLSLNRVRGSSTITQFCRSVVAVYRIDEDNPEAPSRVESLKFSFGKPPEPFGFTITDDGMEFHEAPEEERPMTATDRAAEFLRVELRRRPQRYTELLQRGEAQGVSRWSMYQARDALGVVVVNGFWSLSTTRTPEQQESAELPK